MHSSSETGAGSPSGGDEESMKFGLVGTGYWARRIVSAFVPDSPYASSTWRREKGALWDVGPHALSVLTAALGPVVGVTADSGAGDLVHLVFHHAAGATSTASLTLDAPS